MRITSAKKQENRDRILAVASELFRERGFDGVGVADVMDRAGFTHGGFYNHFSSKESLIAEATAAGFSGTVGYAGLDPLAAVEIYLSREHRDARGTGCPAAALSCEVARQPAEARVAFAGGIENVVRSLAAGMERDHGQEPVGARAQAISLFAQAVGAIVLSRSCPQDSSLADEILDACRDACRKSIGTRGRKQIGSSATAGRKAGAKKRG